MMNKLLVAVLFLWCGSCSSKTYDYRSQAKTFSVPMNPTGTATPSAMQYPVNPMNYGNMAIPPQISAPRQAPPVSQQQNGTFYYPYKIQQDNQPDNTGYLQDFYGKRAQDRTKQYEYIEEVIPQKQPREFNSITGGYNNVVNGLTMDVYDERKFGVMSSDSFGPGSKPGSDYAIDEAVGFENQQKVLNNLDNNILETLISDDPLSTGLYPSNIPAY